MKAIVLTYDKNRRLTEHMLHKYRELWPNHPFQFRIPVQNRSSVVESKNIEYVETPPDIKTTVLGLLDGLPDDEMIYWCMDDKYPIALDTDWLNNTCRQISSGDFSEVDGLLFCRCRNMWNKRCLYEGTKKIGDEELYERVNYKQIWLHQFMRVKVLRHLFLSFPDVIAGAKEMDHFKDNLRKPEDHRIFVTCRNYSVMGESASRGVLTKNCHDSLEQCGLEPPEWFDGTLATSSLFGTRIDNLKRRTRYVFSHHLEQELSP